MTHSDLVASRMTRHDPNGHEKRRAKKGERRCGECSRYCCEPSNACVTCRLVFRNHFDEYTDYDDAEESARCRADDYAGDCEHYQEVSNG